MSDQHKYEVVHASAGGPKREVHGKKCANCGRRKPIQGDELCSACLRIEEAADKSYPLR